ncbi:MAG: ring,2-phenylacetyl-CoA epoxidase subunit PaaA [Chloroflexota bacterium]|nr:ring,2-phenylacetyl-CoA epoxidase subunit PaaA [Chloroflexota bacterium]
MFTDTLEREDLEQVDPEYLDLLRRILKIQADCEIGGPHLYVDHILPSAPTKGTQLKVAQTAAEEIDHFRKIARLAGEIGEDVSEVLSWSNQQRYLEAFRTTITTWEDFSVFGFLIDRVGRYQLEEFVGGSYGPLDRAVRTMEPEEEGHIKFGMMETARLALRGGDSKERAQRALDTWYPKALDMFGRSESARSERFRYWGLKRRTNDEQRQQYIAEVNPLIAKMGLTVPDPLVGRRYL